MELTYVLSSLVDCFLFMIYQWNYTILLLAFSLLIAKNSFKGLNFCPCTLFYFSGIFFCFSYCELQNLLLNNTFIFFSTWIHI